MVLDDLVLYDPHAGLRHSLLGQGDAGLVGRHGSGLENGVHPFLGIAGKLLLGLTDPGQQCLEALFAVYHRILGFLCHIAVSPFQMERWPAPQNR